MGIAWRDTLHTMTKSVCGEIVKPRQAIPKNKESMVVGIHTIIATSIRKKIQRIHMIA